MEVLHFVSRIQTFHSFLRLEFFTAVNVPFLVFMVMKHLLLCDNCLAISALKMETVFCTIFVDTTLQVYNKCHNSPDPGL